MEGLTTRVGRMEIVTSELKGISLDKVLKKYEGFHKGLVKQCWEKANPPKEDATLPKVEDAPKVEKVEK